jgi:hypothetical protein
VADAIDIVSANTVEVESVFNIGSRRSIDQAAAKCQDFHTNI